MKKGVIAGVLSGACWGTVFMAPLLLAAFSPFLISSCRYIFYGVISLLYALTSPAKSLNIFKALSLKDFKTLVVLVFTGNIIYYTFVVKATTLIGIAPVSLIQSLVPVSAVLFGRGENSPKLKTLLPPVALIVLGLIALNADVFSAVTGATSGEKALGVLLAFAALASWSYFAVQNAKYLRAHKNFTSEGWSMVFGTLTGFFALLIFLVIFCAEKAGIFLGVLPAAGAERLILVCLGLAVVPSFLGHLFWNKAAELLPVSLSAQMIVFEATFALLYGFIYYGRLPRMLEWWAIALLISGVLWSIRRHRGVS